MGKICFLRDYQVQAVNGPLYKKDQVEEMSDSSCEHFVSRRVAKYATEVVAVKATAAKTPEPKDKGKAKDAKPAVEQAESK